MPPCNEQLRHAYKVWRLVKEEHTLTTFCERDWKMYGFRSARSMYKALEQRISKQRAIEERGRFEGKQKGWRSTKGLRFVRPLPVVVTGWPGVRIPKPKALTAAPVSRREALKLKYKGVI